MMRFFLTGLGVWIMPWAVIWALNTLFAAEIPYTAWSWLAAVLLMLVLSIRLNVN